jgi:hypothetical protein
VHHVCHPLSMRAGNLWLISPISILQEHCEGGIWRIKKCTGAQVKCILAHLVLEVICSLMTDDIVEFKLLV